MKIAMDGTLVEFVPESEGEKKDLAELWNLVLDCAGKNLKLVPVGEFVALDPGRSKVARFNLED